MLIHRLALLTGMLFMTITDPVLAAPRIDSPGQLLITNFSPASTDLGWYVLNDNVMGGRSTGDFVAQKKMLRFAGRTNTKGGGFSSIRTGDLDLDLSDYAGIRVRVKGDGRQYTWRIATNARWRGRLISYWASFATQDNTWITVDLPFSAFMPKMRGYELDGPALDTQRISGMGLMIYDNKDGPFEIELASVHAYAELTPFSLADYQWNKRVLILSAPDGDDKHLKAQLATIAASRDDFKERDMTLVVILNTGPSTAGERTLSATEAAGVQTRLGIDTAAFALRLIGKDGSVKHRSAEPTAMTDLYALIDTMPMRRREQESQQ